MFTTQMPGAIQHVTHQLLMPTLASAAVVSRSTR
jgi:hypothetical protein